MKKASGFLIVLLAVCGMARAQTTVPVLLLSDIHFDPYADASKFAALRTAPVEKWPEILSLANAAKVAEPCPSRGVDTDWALLQSSLRAEQQHLAKPLFVTVSGDLMAHEFDCRFKALTPKADAQAYSEFSAKTVAFVAMELKRTFPGVPVYLALGNNDSGCGDYHEEENSAFLASFARNAAIAAEIPSTTNEPRGTNDSKEIVRQAAVMGSYNVALPRPMQHTRMISLQDVYQAKKFKTCADGDGTPLREKQLAWLRAQLLAARAAHESAWVMAHIPPGVDEYATARNKRNMCAGDAADVFLSDDALAQTLGEFGDVVSLVLLGHTHNDEMRLYRAKDGSPATPAKLVPSITPINGNHPAFTMAEIDTAAGKMLDYAVIAAESREASSWVEAYRYSKVYSAKDFSAASVATLITGFHADETGVAPLSHSYQQNFFPGDPLLHAAALQLVWPEYVCSMTHTSQSEFHNCVCFAKPAAAQP